VSVLLALLSSLFYGSADFLGGLASRRAPVLAVVVTSQAAGFAVLALVMPLLPAAHPTHAEIAWGAAAGATGGLGVALLYRALALGPMSIVAPVTAVSALSIPVVVGLALGERPGAVALAGVLVAVAAIVLISREPESITAGGSRASRVSRGVWIALAAGVVIGVFYVCLARTSSAAGLWPLLVARAVSVTLFAAAGLLRRERVIPGAGAWLVVLAAGVLDMLANVLYLLAVRGGLMSVVSPLASLYPAATVLLAALVLRERIHRVQAFGLGAAAVAVALITAGSAAR
jgi:drug/metabolite transporter (DMT)-like permease